ncbi:uncharacterized protein LOC122661320 [Telopea speciosissima]|uniref:uncharacterized protein LOC122661320 n=1 Tax=Telopea speciosissima TaxID=54955 RepID=UPI001CC361B6|nr:uncharacterized protein LOC122661320 [Telopea speciosissima]
MRTDEEGFLTMALNKRKFTYAIGVPRNLGRMQTKIQKKKSFLFPDLQETMDAAVLLEFMKIKWSILVVAIDPTCHRCGVAKESIDHLLLECPFTKAVWYESLLSYIPPSDRIPKLAEWLNSWDLLIRQDKKVNRESLSQSVITSSNPSQTNSGAISSNEDDRWNAPPLGFIKALSSAIQGEALAIREALMQARELGITYLLVESDNKEIISFIEDPNRVPPLDVAVVVEDVRELRSPVVSVSFLFVSRTINIIADALTKKTLSIMCMTD